ncbi:MAG: DUF1800 domain-containing protein [Bacteroidetes bacterium]|nr:DUF1800 domain-containing protein [Bacteroidota bacterium]
MVISNQLKNQHLMWRAGFGPMAEDLDQLQHFSQKSLFKALLKSSASTPDYIDVADSSLKGLMMGVGDVVNMQKMDLSDEQKKQLRQQSQKDIKSLNLSWLNEMVNSNAQLREKMSLFWHGHFATRNLNIFYQQLLLDVIRKNALGNFGDLLREVSKTAAMINFLNNNQNKKDHPNENFAREVMELFTMGRGNYSETDVKEAARAFTGWGANLRGNFVFRKFQHDDGTKTVLNQHGNFDGDDVLNILLEQKQTAYFITKKIYRYLVNDIADESNVKWLSNRFYNNNYDIKLLLEDIFTSDWFYDIKNIGSHIKSPIELIAGIRRILPMEIQNEESQLLLQRLLGQLLFYPPNVAGWPGGMNWIDSSTLMFRLRIPQIVYSADEFQMKPKDDDDQMMGMRDFNENGIDTKSRLKVKGAQMINAKINWDAYLKKFNDTPREKLPAAIALSLLQTPSSINDDILNKYIDISSRESFIKTMTIQLMSTPEYQLC